MGRCHIIYVLSLGFVAVLNTGYGENAALRFECPEPGGDTFTMEAVYLGPGTPLSVIWTFFGSSLTVETSGCSLIGTVPASFPDPSRLSYKCATTDVTLPAKSYQLIVSGLQNDILGKTWAVTFTPQVGAAAAAVQTNSPSDCSSQTTTVSVTVFESDDVRLACTLTGSFTLPEWRGPPQLMKYTDKDDTSETISHQAPAAGRLQYASNKKDLVLSNAERNDSGDYSCSYKALGVHTVILTVTDSQLTTTPTSTTTPAKTTTATTTPATTTTATNSTRFITGPFTTHFPGTLQQIHIKDNKVPVKGGEVQIVCDIVHFSDADTVRVYKTDSILTSDITTAQSLASCNPTRCFGTEPRHTFSSSYSGVIITITNLHSSDDQKYWTCVMNNQQISMQLTVYYSRSDIYTSTTETSYTMPIVLGAVCFVVLIYAIGLTILYKRKTKKEGSASNSANGTYANENLGNISDATVGQHYENEATVLPSPQYTELAHYTNERTTYERLQN